MINWLNHIDTWLFIFINGMHTSWLDVFMYDISQYRLIWLPLYALLFGMIWLKYKRKSALIVLAFIAMVIMADQTASAVLKPLVCRFRPTHCDALKGIVHIVNGYEGGLFGFVSSHAANTFSVALLTSLIMRKKWIIYLFFSWSLLVSYSRIYLGVHYPGDVLGGFIVGTIYALLIYKLLELIFHKIYKNDLHHSAQ